MWNIVKRKWIPTILLISVLVITGCSQKTTGNTGSGDEAKKTLTITVWNYYNGVQQEVFNRLVDEFNKSVGAEKGIRVAVSSYGTTSDLRESVMDVIGEKAGAEEMPTIFSTYADTAYELDQLGVVVDLESYLTGEEKEEYITSYIEEGEFGEDGSLKIFPVAKATEIMMINKTDWDKFANETGTSLENCSTIEGVTEVARLYYEWSGGKAFFGRDAIANYIFVGTKQLGMDLLEIKDGETILNYDESVMRKIWDNYYVPFINGYFASSGRFRSDDIKTGNIISFVGSSAGATFFPSKVNISDTQEYDIESIVMEAPQFAGSAGYAVQQGAGMVVLEKSEEETKAAVEFLKWFTDSRRNLEFSNATGYLPVKKEANQKEFIEKNAEVEGEVMEIVTVSLDTVNNNVMYNAAATKNSTEIRTYLETMLSDKASADRVAIDEQIKAGENREEVIAQYDTDENFSDWYKETKENLEQIVSK